MIRTVFGAYFFILCVSSHALAQSRLSGFVTDAADGTPVIGAVLRMDEDYLWAVTDADGRYSIDRIAPGEYTLTLSCLGYADVSRTVKIGRSNQTLDLRIRVNSLALEEVVVVAETSKDNNNTVRKMGRNALDHLQMADLASIVALLPGGKTTNPDLTDDNVMSLRSGGSSTGNAAFGTAVEVDGVRIGGNADFSGLNGISTRSIAVDNIESVEVMTGVPSAEYGDLNSGIVRVTTKKGRAPLNVNFTMNPRTYQVSVSKGIQLDGKKGVLNIGGEWARATSKLSSPYTSYTRRGFTFEYSNTFRKVLRLEAGLSGNFGGMNSKDDPDTFSEDYTRVRDNSLTPHFKLVWLLNRSWVTNLSLDGSIYYNDKLSHAHEYNSSASSQPAVHAEEEGYYIAASLPLEYYSDQITDSKELDYAASLKYDWLKHFGGIRNVLKAGLQWKSNGNVGQGEYYEDESLAATGYRPRAYKDYPYMHNLATYITENLTIPVGSTLVNMDLGLRYENVFVKGTKYSRLHSLSPRLNARWTLSGAVSIRGGWGVTEKLPSFYMLYPEQQYRDIRTFSYSYGSEGAATYIYYTIPYRTEYNPELKWQKNHNSELGVDLSLGGFNIGFVGYCNITMAPYMYSTVYEPFTYNIMQLPTGYTVSADTEVMLDNTTGYVYFRNPGETSWTRSALGVTDETFVANKKPDNGDKVVRTGLELTLDFPEIRPIRTQFRIDAAYAYTRYHDQYEVWYYNTGWSHTSLSNRSYQYVGIYAGNSGVYNGRRTHTLDANITAITHIPQARLVVTCRLEAALLRRYQYISEYKGETYAFTVDSSTNTDTGGSIYDGDSYTAIYPIAYMTLDGVIHEWTEAEANDDEYSSLILRSGNIYTFDADGYDPYFSANISITKEIGDHVSLSFFANNFTNSRRYVKSYANGVSAIFTPDFYYGLTCRLKF